MNDQSPSLLLVAEHPDPRRGGQERSTVELSRALKEEGLLSRQLFLGCPPEATKGPSFEDCKDLGSRRIRSWTESLLQTRRQLLVLRRKYVVLSMLPLPEAHLYLPWGGLYPEAYQRSAASHGAGPPAWLARLGTALNRKRRLLLGLEKEALKSPDGPLLVAISSYVARQGRRHYGLGRSRMALVRNAVALDGEEVAALDREALRAARGIGEETVVFLAAAHNHRLKGVFQLLRALAGLKRFPPWLLRVAGGSSPSRNLPFPARFLGPLSDIREELAAADVLVHPTFYDPASRVVLEALAAGLPVVTTRFNGASDFLQSGGGRVLSDPRDVGALRQALEDFLDPRERARQAALARTQREGLSMARQGREMAALVRRVFKERVAAG